MERQTNFTCCYCLQCAYEPHCVHKTAFVFDALIFGSLCLQFLSYFGEFSIVGIVFFLISLVFMGMVFLSIRHLCTYNTMLANGTFLAAFQKYMKIRKWAIIGVIVLGLIFGILIYIILNSKYKKGDQVDSNGVRIDPSRASSIAFYYCLNIIMNYLITASILLGYERSFHDSTAAFLGPSVVVMNIGGAGPGTFAGRQRDYQGERGAFHYQGGPPVAIGGTAQMYNNPVPLRVQQPPQMDQINLRAEGSKPGVR